MISVAARVETAAPTEFSPSTRKAFAFFRAEERCSFAALTMRGVRSVNACSKSNAMVFNLPSTKRSEEHTSELQSRGHLVCRLLLEKKTSTKKFSKQRMAA